MVDLKNREEKLVICLTLIIIHHTNQRTAEFEKTPPCFRFRCENKTLLTVELSFNAYLYPSPLPSPWGASCPLRKALIMLFRDEVSKRIGIAFAVPENNVHLTLFEKGGPLAVDEG